MEHYLEQLIEDLHQIIRNLNQPLCEDTESKDKIEMLDFSQIEKYERNELTPVSQITGIEQAQLPPAEMLNEAQQALLATELEELLDCFHLKLDFPRNYPAHLRYSFIRKFWSEEQVSVTFGTIHYEFCNYEQENCPFPGYCTTCSEDWQVKDAKDDLQDSEAYKDLFADDDEDTPYTEDISEFYDDHGNRIDATTVPVPELCRRCRNNLIVDWDENLLCLMNRYDQRNATEFECGVFQEL